MAKVRVIQPNGVTIEFEDDDLDMLTKLIDLYHLKQSISSGSVSLDAQVTQEVAQISKPLEKDVSGSADQKTFSWAVKSWIDYIEPECNKKGTLKKYTGYANSLIDILDGDFPIKQITPTVISETRNKIINYPKNRWSVKNSSRSLSELLDDKDLPRISRSTAKEYMRILKSVLEYMYVLDIIDTNPARNIHIGKAGKSSSVERVPFTNDDLIRIFNGSIYHGNDYIGKMKLLDAYFWAPLIALYMGLRVAEIGQLTIGDINLTPENWHGKVFDIPYINVDDIEDFQSIKNENSRRKVPIHKNILQLGFAEFVKSRLVEEKGNSRAMLFEYMVYQENGGWGRKISRWFCGDGGNRASGYRRSVGIADYQGKVFHSFRHTFIDMMRNMTCNNGGEYITAVLAGHEVKSSTSKYGDGLQLDTLQKYIDLVCYSDEVEELVKSLDFNIYRTKAKRFWRR